MAKIFCTKQIPESSFSELRDQGYEIKIWNDRKDGNIPRERLLTELRDTDALITMLSDKIDQDLIDSAPKLKIISQYAVGFNNIDVNYAAKKNIVVTNTPDVLTHATAELAFSLLTSCARRIVEANKNFENNEWKGWEPLGFLGKSLKETTVGIIGAGRIGSEFAKMCHGAFDSKILYYSRTKKQEIESSLDATKSELEELLRKSDIISIHCALTDETKNLLNAKSLALCKSDAIIINTARGEVIDQNALIACLENGKFHSIGLDVTTPEPLPEDNKLRGFKNVLIIPHIGSATTFARENMGKLVCKNVEMVLSNNDPITPITT